MGAKMIETVDFCDDVVGNCCTARQQWHIRQQCLLLFAVEDAGENATQPGGHREAREADDDEDRRTFRRWRPFAGGAGREISPIAIIGLSDTGRDYSAVFDETIGVTAGERSPTPTHNPPGPKDRSAI
jgi:hypothetical protein